MSEPLTLTLTVPDAECIERAAQVLQSEAKRTSSLRGKIALNGVVKALQRALDARPCPTCHGQHLCRRSVWDLFAQEIATEFPGELTTEQEAEIEVRRDHFAEINGPELQLCPRCQAPAVRERRVA